MAVDVIIDPLTGQIYWNDSQGTAQSIAISGNGTDLIKTVGYSLQFSAAPVGTITTGSATTAVSGSGTNFLTLFGSGAAGSGAVLYTSQGTSIGTISTVSSDTALSLQANASGSYTGITFRYSPPAGTDRLILSDSSTPIYPATTGANLGTSSYRWSLYASLGDITNSGTTAINLMLDKSGIGSTESPALQFINTTAATSGAQYQFAPWNEFRGKAWNTGSSASNDVRMRMGMAALSGNTPTSEFVIASSVDTGTASWYYPLTLNATANDSVLYLNNGVISIGKLLTSGTTSSYALELYNYNLATSGQTANWSPAFEMNGSAWNTSTATSNILRFRSEVQTTSGNPISGSIFWKSAITTSYSATPSFSNNLSLSNTNGLGLWNANTAASYLKASGSQSSDIVYTFPASVPTANQVLSASSVSGSSITLTWATTASGSGTVNSGSSGKVAYYPSAGTTVDDATALDYSTTSPHLSITAQATTAIPLKLIGIASQSVDLFQVATSGANVFTVGSAGISTFANSTAATTTTSGALIITGGIGVGSTSYLSTTNIITLTLTNALAVGQGGTGTSSAPNQWGVIFATSTSQYNSTAAGSTDQVLKSGGGSGAPSFGSVNLASSNAVSGTLPLASGGLGTTTFTQNGVLYGNLATSILVTAASGAVGAILQTTSSGGVPSFSTSLPGTYSFSSSTAASSTTVAAVVFSGGIGVGSTSYLSDLFTVGTTLSATSATTINLGTSAATKTINIGTGGTSTHTTTITIGTTAGTSTLTIESPTVATNTTSLTLFNVNATTVNAFGAATALTLGATTGTTTIRNTTVTLTNATSITGTSAAIAMFGESTTFTLMGTTAASTTNIATGNNGANVKIVNIATGGTGAGASNVNVGVATGTFTVSSATSNIGTTAVSGTVAILSSSFTANNATTFSATSATTLSLGASTGTATIGNTTFALTNATSITGTSAAITAFGESTSFTLMATTAASTTNIASGNNGTNAKTLNLATGGAGTGVVNVNVGSSTGTFTVNSATSNIGTTAVSGTVAILSSTFTANNATTFSATSATTLSLGASTGTATIGNTTFALTNATSITGTSAAITMFGESTSFTLMATTAASTINIATGNNGANAKTLNLATGGTGAGAVNVNVGVATGTFTINSATSNIGTTAVSGTVAVLSSTFTANNATTFSATSATTLTLGATTGTATIRNTTVTLTNATSITGTSAAITMFGESTSFTLMGTTAASTINIATGNNGANAKTLNLATGGTGAGASNVNVGVATGTFTVNSATSNIGTTAVSGTVAILSSSFTANNATTFSATSATTLSLGASTGTATIGNTTFTLTNATSITGTSAAITMFGESTSFTLMATTAASTTNIATGNNGANAKTLNLATGGTGAGAVNVNVGVATGTFTINSATSNIGTTAVSGTVAVLSSTFTANNATTFSATSATTLSLGASTGTATIGNTTFTLTNATSITGTSAAITMFGESTSFTLMATTAASTTNIASGNNGANAKTVNIATGGTGAGNSNINIGVSTGTASVKSSTFDLANATSITGSASLATVFATANPASLALFGAATTVTIFGAATTLSIGSTSGTVTIANATATFSGTTANFSANTAFSLGASVTGASTLNIGTGAVAGAIKAINIGTGGSGTGTSTIIIGTTSGTSTITLNGVTTLSSALAVGSGGTGTSTAPTQWGVIFATSTSAYNSTAAGTNNQWLRAVSSGAPTWSTATLATTYSQYDLVYASASNGLSGLANTNTSVLVSQTAGPVWLQGATGNRLLKTNGSAISWSQADLTTDVTGVLPIANGGTQTSSITAGGVVYMGSTAATGLQALSPAAANKFLVSTGAATTNYPAWSTATLATTYASGDLLYASSSNTVGGLTSTATSVLITQGAAAPSWLQGATGNRILKTSGSVISWAQVALSTDVTGTLPVGNGGTGLTTLTSEYIPYGAGTNAFASTSALTFSTSSGTLNATILRSSQSSGNEGGEIQLALAGTTTLSSGVAIDVFNDRVRIFETGGTNRGAYIDLSAAAASAGTNLLAGGGSGTVSSGAAGALAYYPSLGTTVDDAAAMVYSASNQHLTITAQGAATSPLRLVGTTSQTADLFQIFSTSAGTVLGSVGAFGGATFTSLATSATAPATALVVTGAAHTALNTATEYSDVYFNLGQTKTFATGGIATLRTFRVAPATYAFSGVSTVTNAATFQIDGAPAAGTNATLTEAAALRILTGTASGKGLVIRGATSQTGNYIDVQNNSGTSLVTLGTTNINLAPHGASAGNTFELRFSELAAGGTEYIAFKAPDALTTSYTYVLPSAAPSAGQLLSASAPSAGVVTLSWATDQLGTSGGGITSLNGLAAASQSFANDTNVTITSLTATHTLGWQGELAISRGGTGTSTAPTQWGVMFATSSTAIRSTAAAGSTNQWLASVSAGAPVWSTATLATTYAAGDLLYASSGNVVGGLTSTATSVLITQGAAAPSWLQGATGNRLLKTSGSVISWGQVDLASGDVTGTLAIGNGGTGTSTAPTQWGVMFATSASAIRSTAAGTNNQWLAAVTAGAPVWSTATLATTFSIGQFLYASGANAVTGLATTTLSVDTTNIRIGIGTSAASTPLHVLSNASATNTVVVMDTLDVQSSATPANGFGGSILFDLESSTTAGQDAASIETVWATATHASRLAELNFKTNDANTSTLAERMSISNITTAQSSTNATVVITGTLGVNSTSYLSSLSLNTALGITSGGTNTSSFATTNGLVYFNGTNLLTTNAAASGVLVTNGSNVPSIGTDIPAAVTIGGGYIYRASGTDVPLADGGTNASLTGVAGGVVYSTALAMAITTAGSSGQPLLSGGSGAPTFGTLGMGAGGTGLTATAPGANYILGMNSGNSGLEYKQLVQGSNITITHAANQVTITASGGSATAGGSDTQIQYNNATALAGISNFTFASNLVSLTNATNFANTSTPGMQLKYNTAAGTTTVNNNSPALDFIGRIYASAADRHARIRQEIQTTAATPSHALVWSSSYDTGTASYTRVLSVHSVDGLGFWNYAGTPGSAANYFKTGNQASDIRYTWPTTAPTTNQVLSATTVSGSDITLGWATAGGGAGTVGSGTINQLAYYSGATTTASDASLVRAATGTHLTITAQGASTSPLKVVGAASQSAALFTVATSGADVLVVGSGGAITTGTWNGTAIGVLYGGTGQTTYTDGQLLIGNSTGNTLTKATLTAGNGIGVTNGAGSITVRTKRVMNIQLASGFNPPVGADTAIIRIPESPTDGTTSVTYNVRKVFCRVETPSSGTSTFQVEYYTGTSAFSGTNLLSSAMSVTGAAVYEFNTTGFTTSTLATGAKIRLNFSAVNSTHANFSINLLLEEN
jgi:hypothetical protein